MNPLQEAMPTLLRHKGVWEGWYRYYDANGDKIDEHRSEVICRFPEDGEYAYHQTSRFIWADGRTEVREFPTRLQGDRLILSGIIEGWAAEVSLDEHRRTVMLYWRRQEHSELYLYEMIQISDCSRYRNRVWQWFTDDGRLARRTLIDEQKVSQD